MEIVKNRLSTCDFIRLYEDAGWGALNESIVEKAIRNSYATFSLVNNDETIAMARILSDSAMVYYLKDFVVLSKYQRMGYGTTLIKYIIDYIKEDSPEGATSRLEIMSAGGKEPFYKKMNFIKSSGNGMVLSVDHCTERKNIEYKPSFYNIIVDETPTSKIIFNSVTGAIAQFDNVTYQKIMDPLECSKLEQTSKMNELGFLVDINDDEWAKLFYDRQCYIFNPNPVTLGFVIAPTLKCNLNCPYCFENDNRHHNRMSADTVEKTIDYIIRTVNSCPFTKEVYIVWFGGEPCLEVDIIRKISKHIIPFLNSKGIKYNSRITTNGVLLSENVASILKKECQVNSAQITIDGLSQNYSIRKKCNEELFFKLIENIISICEIISVNIRINIDKDNYEEIPQLLQYLLDEKKLNGKININFAQLQNWNNETDRKYLTGSFYIDFLKSIHHTIIKNNWTSSFKNKRPFRQVGPCGSMRCTHSTIDPDGFIYRCEHCLGSPEWSIGTIQDGKIHNKNDMTFLCRNLPAKCSQCQAFPICAGGCTANEILHGIPASNCDIFMEIIKENVMFAVKSQNIVTH